MKFKKRINGSWADIPHYIHNTDTDTITAFPTVLYPTGTTATVGLKGQTVQSGTPTPDNPIMPEGAGERTGNLFDIDNVIENHYLNNGVPTQYNIGRYLLSDYIPIASGTATISAKITISSYYGAHWAVYDENKTFIRGGIAFDANGSGIKVRVVDTSGAAFIRVDYSVQYLTDCMLNLGSTALPYEPYGYKIPISSAGQTMPIYLGEVETTRRIKKLVLTGGQHDGDIGITPRGIIYITPLRTLKNVGDAYCTHYKYVNQNQGIDMPYNSFTTRGGDDTSLWFKTEYATIADFKDYLAAQYAAGTPVTIWYVLAEPETGIANEPLMKIGDYADEVANVSIPVTAGGDTLSVDTTVQPSEVTVNYKGWHDTTVKQFNGTTWE